MSLAPGLPWSCHAALLVLTCASAYFGAFGVADLVGAELSLQAEAIAAALQPPLVPDPSPVPVPSAARILARNAFDSAAAPLARADVDRVPATDDAEGPVDPMGVPPCQGVSVSILVTSDDDLWSFAALRTAEGAKVRLVRGGVDVDGKRVLHVGLDRVWLGDGRRVCQARLFEARRTMAVESVSVGRARSLGGVPPSIAQGIERAGPTEVNVTRQALEQILENPSLLMSQVRIDGSDGKGAGLRVTGIRPDSLLGLAGLENGDRLLAINGFHLANLEKAMEAYARLRVADHLTLHLDRGGRPVNLDFNVR